LATARAQNWDPAEVRKLLLNEEFAGRERSALATRTFPLAHQIPTPDISAAIPSGG
jgi:hypothetical protein